MEQIDIIKEWFKEYPLIWNIAKFIFIVAFVLILVKVIRKKIRKIIPNVSIRYKSEKGVELFALIILVLIAITYFTGTIKDFTLVIGILTAGIAFTLQELILSIAGSIYIFLLKVYKPGDRIEINGTKGDVIDVDIIYTTMMEIGQWVSSDNYSGRIVKLSNAFVFKGPVYNYSQDFPFIWDEFNLPIRYGSDIDLAKSIVLRIASESLSEYTSNSKTQWKEIVNKYYVEDAQLDPTLAITLTDNWIQFNLRYIVDFKKRRLTKHELYDKVRKEFENTEGKVILASTTLEMVNIPDIKINLNEPKVN